MITSILKWGLGNRMIQIAHIYLKSKINGVEYFFDDNYCFYIQHNLNSYYKDNVFSKLNFKYSVYEDSPVFQYKYIENDYIFHDEKYNLEYFNEKVRLEQEIFKSVKNQYCNYDKYIFKKIKSETYLNKIKTIELNNHFDNFFICDYDFVNYDFTYFYLYLNELYNLFVNEEIINNLKNKYKKLLKNSLSLHVRRTDYLTIYPEFIKENDYYYDCIKKLENEKKIDNILIFSDDMQWCKENIKDDRITYIEGQKDYEDLYLMSLCENNVILDSSFSWWGQFLNKNEDKIVFRPDITIWT
jgi:hypothetical protein